MHDGAPQAAGVQHVRLVHAGQLFAALHGRLKADAADALDVYKRQGWFKALWQTIVTDGLFCLTLVFFASAIYNTDPFAVYGSLLQG